MFYKTFNLLKAAKFSHKSLRILFYKFLYLWLTCILYCTLCLGQFVSNLFLCTNLFFSRNILDLISICLGTSWRLESRKLSTYVVKWTSLNITCLGDDVVWHLCGNLTFINEGVTVGIATANRFHIAEELFNLARNCTWDKVVTITFEIGTVITADLF